MLSVASLSSVRAASNKIAINLSHILPKKYSGQVGQPLIVVSIIPEDRREYQTKSDPAEVIAEKILMPYFEDGRRVKQLTEWKPERVN